MKFFRVFDPVSHHRIVIVDQLRSPKGLRKNSERSPKVLRKISERSPKELRKNSDVSNCSVMPEGPQVVTPLTITPSQSLPAT